MTTRDFQKSEALLKRTLKTIPLGSQTFSKSHTQYARGVSPFFISRGEGARVWDVDGNEYIDFVSALAAITLGYNDPAVTAAVQAQLAEGTLFSLPHPIEMEVAEAIVEMVPCAEMVRFGKNGSDATAGAVRGKWLWGSSALVQRRRWPPSWLSVGFPHCPQKTCLWCQCISPRA